jgi:hypothetical protein
MRPNRGSSGACETLLSSKSVGGSCVAAILACVEVCLLICERRDVAFLLGVVEEEENVEEDVAEEFFGGEVLFDISKCFRNEAQTAMNDALHFRVLSAPLLQLQMASSSSGGVLWSSSGLGDLGERPALFVLSHLAALCPRDLR